MEFVNEGMAGKWDLVLEAPSLQWPSRIALAPAADPAPDPAFPTVNLGMIRQQIAELDMGTAMADLREAEEN